MTTYSRLLEMIFNKGLNIFYQAKPRGSVLPLDDENKKLINKSIEKYKIKIVDLQTFLFTHQL